MKNSDLCRQEIKTVPVALAWLREVAGGRDAEAAIEHLKMVQDAIPVLTAYRQMFPGAFNRSAAPLLESDRDWPEYTAREGEFMRLLDSRNMIPIHLADEWEWLQERQIGIPIPPLQGHQWCCFDFSPDELSDAFYLGHSIITEEWAQACERYHLPAEDYEFLPEVNVPVFEERLTAEHDALRFLPVTTHLMQYTTGNVFLDSSYCQEPSVIRWSVKNIRRLAEEHRRARLLLDGVFSLDDLIEADPGGVYARVREIWNQARPLKP